MAVHCVGVQVLHFNQGAQHVQVAVVGAEVVGLSASLPDKLRVQAERVFIDCALFQELINGCVATKSTCCVQWSVFIDFNVEVTSYVFKKLQNFN
jgi:hypothetical protein